MTYNDFKFNVIDRLNLIVNRKDNTNITLKQVCENNSHYLNWKVGNNSMDFARLLLKEVSINDKQVIYFNRYYNFIDINTIIDKLNISELQAYKELFKLQDLEFIKVVVNGSDVYVLFNLKAIREFTEIGQQRLINKVNTFDNN